MVVLLSLNQMFYNVTFYHIFLYFVLIFSKAAAIPVLLEICQEKATNHKQLFFDQSLSCKLHMCT